MERENKGQIDALKKMVQDLKHEVEQGGPPRHLKANPNLKGTRSAEKREAKREPRHSGRIKAMKKQLRDLAKAHGSAQAQTDQLRHELDARKHAEQKLTPLLDAARKKLHSERTKEKKLEEENKAKDIQLKVLKKQLKASREQADKAVQANATVTATLDKTSRQIHVMKKLMVGELAKQRDKYHHRLKKRVAQAIGSAAAAGSAAGASPAVAYSSAASLSPGPQMAPATVTPTLTAEETAVVKKNITAKLEPRITAQVAAKMKKEVTDMKVKEALLNTKMQAAQDKATRVEKKLEARPPAGVVKQVQQLKQQLAETSAALQTEKTKRKTLLQEKAKRQQLQQQNQQDEVAALKKQLQASKNSATAAVEASAAMQDKYEGLQSANQALQKQVQKAGSQSDKTKLATLQKRVTVMKELMAQELSKTRKKYQSKVKAKVHEAKVAVRKELQGAALSTPHGSVDVPITPPALKHTNQPAAVQGDALVMTGQGTKTSSAKVSAATLSTQSASAKAGFTWKEVKSPDKVAQQLVHKGWKAKEVTEASKVEAKQSQASMDFDMAVGMAGMRL
jgi:hypothetical protein